MQYRQGFSSGAWVKFAQAFDEAGFVHCTDLVKDDLAFFALEGERNAGRVITTLGGHGSDDDGGDVLIHLIGRNDDAWSGLADFVAPAGIKADEVNVETGNYNRH